MAVYLVTGYYGPGGRAGTRRRPNKNRPGEREGDLACSVRCTGEGVRDAEVQAFRSRSDIGDVVVTEAVFP